MRAYAGIGSRETPEHILELMRTAARKLAQEGWTLRSGAAKGADQAFELGWLDHYVNLPAGQRTAKAEIYLPWDGYEGHGRDGLFGCNILPDLDDPATYQEAMKIAEAIHPNWGACKRGARSMHARNAYQVLGRDLKTPSRFVIAYAVTDKRGNPKGGTATAIKLAKQRGIEVFNLYIEEDLRRLKLFTGDTQ